MQLILKVVALLLTYPEAVASALDEILSAMDGCGDVKPAQKAKLSRFITSRLGQDIIDWQEEYVCLFDRNRKLSLHMFEHVHGESRKRGPAMVELLKMYQAQGLKLNKGELPDYLPVFLEFLSCLPEEQSVPLLKQVAPILATLQERLEKKESAYAALFIVLLSLSGEEVGAAAEPCADNAEQEQSLQAMDRLWIEEPVDFSKPCPVDCPVAASCSRKTAGPS